MVNDGMKALWQPDNDALAEAFSYGQKFAGEVRGN